ncbi:MBL fold metallo-hydrolase [Elongatibacter sediminis]|uniref:MBL fold metallo-hydrolase n=1 Tax=Elongatibacter sediminis TaxID=3119006 RepID=A0AAW9R9G1_9GAMM
MTLHLLISTLSPTRKPSRCRTGLVGRCALMISVMFAAPLLAATPMLQPGSTRPIAEDVYLLPDGGVMLVPNVGIVVGSEGILVIDTGMGPANAEIVLSEVREISDLPITFLVSTHFHPEHNFGAQSFPPETVLIYSERQHQEIQNKGEHYQEWFVELFGDDVRALLEPVRLVQPDVTFERKANFNLGGMPVELHHFGRAAHTMGDTVVFLPEQKVAFAGGLTPNHLFPILADADSGIAGWLESLDGLERLGAEYIVPDHGEPGGPELISRVREYLLAVQKQSSELSRQDVPLEQAQQLMTERMVARYPDWGEPHWIAAAVAQVYAEQAKEN